MNSQNSSWNTSVAFHPTFLHLKSFHLTCFQISFFSVLQFRLILWQLSQNSFLLPTSEKIAHLQSMSSHHKQFSSPDELLDQLDPSWPQSTRPLPPSSPPRKSLYFLVVFDFEEIPISDAELQDSILAKQTFVCDGRMKTSGASHMPRNADQRNKLGSIPSIGTCFQ